MSRCGLVFAARRDAVGWAVARCCGLTCCSAWACGLALPGRRTPPPPPPPPHARPGTVARPQQEGRSVPASVPLQRGKTQTFPEACARAIAGLVWPGRDCMAKYCTAKRGRASSVWARGGCPGLSSACPVLGCCLAVWLSVCLSHQQVRVLLGAGGSKSRVAIAPLSSQTQWAELCDYAWVVVLAQSNRSICGQRSPVRSSTPAGYQPSPPLLPPPLPPRCAPCPSLHLLPSTSLRLPLARTHAPTHPSPPAALLPPSLPPFSNACLVCRAHPPALVLSALPLAAADWPAPGDPSAPSSPPKPPSGFSHHWPHLQLSHALFPRPSCSSAACTLLARPRPTSARPPNKPLISGPAWCKTALCCIPTLRNRLSAQPSPTRPSLARASHRSRSPRHARRTHPGRLAASLLTPKHLCFFPQPLPFACSKRAPIACSRPPSRLPCLLTPVR